MKKKSYKLLIGALLVSMVGGAFAGCSPNETSDGGTFEKNAITLSGSSALLPLIDGSIEKFKEKYPDVEISAQAGGSGTGLTQVSEGSVDIGNSDVLAESKLDETKAKELVDHKVVAQGFGIVVSKDLGVDNLTKQQIKDIFSGKVKNWKEVGGADKEILVIHRPASSGTRASFTEKILDGDKSLENDSIGVTQDNNGAVLNAMKKNEGAISYVALSYMTSDESKEVLTTVKIDGIEASVDNIKSGKYPFWSWGHMYTKGEATDLSKAFIDFVMSEENKESVSSLGFISASEMKLSE